MDVPDLYADVREAFGRLEAAISLADPRRCRDYVTDAFYEELETEVRLLEERGRRRVHADFEVLDVKLLQPHDDGSLTMRVRAVSTLEEFDDNSIRAGEQPLFVWLQDVDVARQEPKGPWLITGLGEMTIERQVSGPVQPLDQSMLDELEARDAERAAHRRDDIDWSEGHTHVAMSFLRLKGIGM
jgi:hypothetical protein